MITNQEKIDMVLNKINNIEAMIISYTNNAEACIDKYSLNEELETCNVKKIALLAELSSLGGSWSEGID